MGHLPIGAIGGGEWLPFVSEDRTLCVAQRTNFGGFSRVPVSFGSPRGVIDRDRPAPTAAPSPDSAANPRRGVSRRSREPESRLAPASPFWSVTTLASSDAQHVGDGSPALRKIGFVRGEAGTSRVAAPSSSCAPWSNPAGYVGCSPRLLVDAIHADGVIAFTGFRTPGIRNLVALEAATPWLTRSRAYASPIASPPSSQGSRPTSTGPPLAGRNSHPQDDESEFQGVIAIPRIPIDRQSPVAPDVLHTIWPGRWERSARSLPRRTPGLRALPSFHAKRNGWYGASLPGPADIAGRGVVGVDRILWGNDYPHCEGCYSCSRESVRFAFADVPGPSARSG